MLSNPRLLKTHYESWALLRDEEKSSMLPNMAAGLGSILFAVSINKPELNGGTSAQRSERLKSHPEPIIEAPIRGEYLSQFLLTLIKRFVILLIRAQSGEFEAEAQTQGGQTDNLVR